MTTALDEVDLAIVGALMVDGRASWRRVARAIDVPFSTVTRRGAALLEAGVVRVSAIRIYGQNVLVDVECEAGRVHEVATVLAARRDTTFVYVTTPPTRLLVELNSGLGPPGPRLFDELLALPGVRDVVVTPTIEYYRTLSQWMPALIPDAAVQRLRESFRSPLLPSRPPGDAADEAIISALVADGRAPIETIAAAAGLSESSTRRRMTGLLGRSVDVRAIVDPVDLGFEVSALVRVAAAPGLVTGMVSALLELPEVRYAVLTAGPYQLLVDMTLPTMDDLGEIAAGQGWSAAAAGVETAVIVEAYKRGGVLLTPR